VGSQRSEREREREREREVYGRKATAKMDDVEMNVQQCKATTSPDPELFYNNHIVFH